MCGFEMGLGCVAVGWGWCVWLLDGARVCGFEMGLGCVAVGWG